MCLHSKDEPFNGWENCGFLIGVDDSSLQVRHAVSSRELFLTLPMIEVPPNLFDEKDIHEEQLCTVRIKRNAQLHCVDKILHFITLNKASQTVITLY